MNKTKHYEKDLECPGKDFPAIRVEMAETALIDHTSAVEPKRTRDYCYYRDQFGANSFFVGGPRDHHLVSVENLEELIINTRCESFMFDWPMLGDKLREIFLRDNLGQIDRLNEIARKYPHVLRLGLLGESETHCYRLIPYSATPQEAYKYYRRMMLKDPASSKERKDLVEALLARNPDATLRDSLNVIFGVTFDPAIGIETCPDKVYGIHPHFDMGADLVHMERSGWNCNCNLAISFLRGGAREYGKKWGLNMSPWGNSHSYGRGPTTYDENNRHVAGNSAELHWFTTMSSLLSGAHEIFHAASEVVFFRHPQPTLFGPSNCDLYMGDVAKPYHGRSQDPGKLGAQFSPAGEYAKRLHQLMENPSFERGRTVVPVALMVELWHGWDTHHFSCEDWAWAGKVPVGRGDRMMSALFELFFPGQALSGRAHDFAYNPDVPFESEYEMMKMFYDGMDIRPFEKGIFVPTPLGDSFDVVTDKVKVDILKEYSITILAGRLSLTPENLPRLRSYVESGGILVVHGMGLGLWDCAGNSTDVPQGYHEEVEALIGCKIKSAFSLGYFPSVICATGERFREGKYEYVGVERKEATPLVEGEEIFDALTQERGELETQAYLKGDNIRPTNNKELNREMRARRENYRYQVGNGTPIVTENRLGKGRVIFCAPHHHLTAQGKQMVKGVKEAIARLVDSFVPVKIHGRPVQFHVNRIEDGYLIGLFNWSEQVWTGNVELRSVKEIRQVDELLYNHEDGYKPVIDGGLFNATVKPYGIGLFKVQM